MPGINQIPAGAEGAAGFSVSYAIISLTCSCLLLWLTIAHREKWSCRSRSTLQSKWKRL
jgi:hypothetical protein